MTAYQEKLQHPNWQMKRLEIMKRDNATCQLCGDTESMLNVHHKSYTWGNDPWDYEDDNFITYCKHCHLLIEGVKKTSNLVIIKVDKVISVEEKKIRFFFILETHIGIAYLYTEDNSIFYATCMQRDSFENLIEYYNQNKNG